MGRALPGGRRSLVRGWGVVVPLLLALAIQVQSPPPREAPRQIGRDSVRVWFWGDDEAAARRTLDAALAPLPLPGLGISSSFRRGTIVLAPTRDAFRTITGDGAPEWAAGVAIPEQSLIVIPSYERAGGLGDEAVTLRHEIAHLALNDYLDGLVPRWFDEGYATWVSGGWDERSGWQIRLALLLGNAPPLDSLSLDWPANESRARLAYLLSASAVRYLATSRGAPAFESFLESWREQGSLDAGLRSVYQITTGQFEDEWRAMVRRRYGWLLAISQITVFWLALVLLVLLLSASRRRRNRERLEALRREEYMLPPAPPGDLDVDSDPG